MTPIAMCMRFDHAEAARADHREMLHVALRPAPIARGDVEQRRRAVFPRAAERRAACAPTSPARRSSAASTKSCDMIGPPNGLLAGQRRQAGRGGEGAHADDRVVTPVVAVLALPRGDAARRRSGRRPPPRTAAAARTASSPPASRGTVCSSPRCGSASISRNQRQQRVGRDDAVGVEHDHEVVAPAPTRDEVVQVAGLAARIVRCAADTRRASDRRASSRSAWNAAVSAHVRSSGSVVSDSTKISKPAASRSSSVSAMACERREARAGSLVVHRHHERRALHRRGASGARAQPRAAEQHAGDGRGRRRARSSRT